MADKFIHFIPSIRRSLLSISAAWSLLLIFSLVSAQTLRLQFPDISNPFYKALFFAIFLSLIQQGITFYAAGERHLFSGKGTCRFSGLPF